MNPTESNVAHATLSSFLEACDLYCKTENFNCLQGLKPILEDIELELFVHYIKFKKETYARNTVYQCQNFEVVLVCWDMQQATQVHNHPDHGCIIRVFEGQLTEKRKDTHGIEEVIILNAGDSCYMCNAYGLHDMSNRGREKAISLHIYSPGIPVKT